MTAALWQGIQLGFFLSILVGPLLFVVLHASVEHGRNAGLSTVLGIWISDLIFIVGSYFALQTLSHWLKDTFFISVVGGIGCMVLVGFGLFLLFSSKGQVKIPVDTSSAKPQKTSLVSFFIRGFAINSLSPFTLFFWMTVAGTHLLQEGKSNDRLHDIFFYTGIMGVLMLTDLGKVLLGHRLQRMMQPRYLLAIRKIAGVLLIAFGVALAVRTWLELG